MTMISFSEENNDERKGKENPLKENYRPQTKNIHTYT